MSNGIFFINDIINHKGTHIQQSATYTVTIFNLIYDFNWPRKHHKKLADCRTWNKEMRTLCDESKDKLCTPIGQWSLDNNKYITYCKWLLTLYLHTLYYREHEKRYKYIRPPNRAHGCIELWTDTKSKSQRPSWFYLFIISLTISTPTNLRI